MWTLRRSLRICLSGGDLVGRSTVSNVGTGIDISIRELAELVAKVYRISW